MSSGVSEDNNKLATHRAWLVLESPGVSGEVGILRCRLRELQSDFAQPLLCAWGCAKLCPGTNPGIYSSSHLGLPKTPGNYAQV